ncbi:MAG: site-specific integrase [Clostridia bacterium]|nr:site-specific integrase [Clostridia bacterium]
MSKKYTGVTPLNKGKTAWQYRIKITLPNGDKIDTTGRRDTHGKPFLTAEAAYTAKLEHENRLRNDLGGKHTRTSKTTLKAIYEHYMTSGEATSKAPSTIAKQNSLWKNHISKKFGDRELKNITLADLQNYLHELYITGDEYNEYKGGYEYAYVEGFLRFFYLLFGYAYRLDKIDYERYIKMFVDRGTRLTMPEMTQADFEDSEGPIETYSEYEIYQMEDLFKSEEGNLLTAFYLGLYCGLRISEVFAVRWRCIDWVKSTITINRQMHYEGGMLKLCPVKTLTSVRTVYMPKVMHNHLYDLYNKQGKQKKALGRGYKNTERVFDTILKTEITEGDFVNRKSNGEILTVNSMKYWSKKIKTELGIDFKFHKLRHTYASNCAANNMNLQMLMEMMGHKKIETTQKYYISTNNPDLIKRTVDLLNTIYQPREVTLPDGSTIATAPANPYHREKTINRIKHTPTKK